MVEKWGKRLVFAGSFILLSACSVVGIRSGTEQPRYSVVARLGDDLEIRRYDPRLAAETTLDTAGEDGRNQAFRRLAGYIFGGNHARSEIAMTTPVETRAGQSIAMTAPVETDGATGVMRFFLPAGLALDTLPLPDDPAVRLTEVPAQTLAVLSFSGARDADTLSERQRDLLARLEPTAWRASGAPSAFLYDPPWTLPFLRRNEVVVAVAPREGRTP